MAELKDIVLYGLSITVGAMAIVGVMTAFFKMVELIGIFSIV